VYSDVKGEGAALAEPSQQHVLAAAQQLRLLFDKVAHDLRFVTPEHSASGARRKRT
jgi:hypothetical protein